MMGKSDEFTFVCENARCPPQIRQDRGLFGGEYIVLRNLVMSLRSTVKNFW